MASKIDGAFSRRSNFTLAKFPKQIQAPYLFKRISDTKLRLSQIPLTNHTLTMLQVCPPLSAIRGSVALLFFGWLLVSHAHASNHQVQFKSTACAQHEKYNRFVNAQECAHAIIKHSSDSFEIVSAYTVLARVEDEYFDHSKADSLYSKALTYFPKNELKTQLYADFLVEISFFHKAYYEFEEALSYLKLALHQIKAKEDRLALELAIASCYTSLNRKDSSDYYLTIAKDGLQESNALMMARYHLYLGQYYFDNSDYVNCVPEIANSLVFYDRLNINMEKAEAYFLMGDAYSEVRNNVRSVELYKNALVLYATVSPEELINTKNTLGWAYYNLKQLDSAAYYLKSALKDYQQTSPNSVLRAYPLGNLGLVYFELDSLKKAERYSKEAFSLFRELGYVPGMSEAQNNLGRIYLKQKKIEEAQKEFTEALRLSNEVWYEPIEVMNSKLGLSKIAHHKNQHQLAYNYLQQATRIKDSIFNLEIATELLADEMDKNISQVVSKLAKVESEKNEKNAALKKSQFALIAISITLVIVIMSSLAIAISWRQRQTAIKKQTEILSINQEIIRMISHDFRGPMNNIRSLMELIRDESMSIQEFNEVSEIIYRQTCDISLMFETFVGWALSQSNNYTPKTEKTDWTENIQDVVNLLTPLAAIKMIDLKIRVDDNHIIETDRIAAQLVLRNLISNAIKYSFENTSIEINVISSTEHVITQVKDYGVGMDHTRIEQIFNADISSKAGTKNEIGSGLGLTMALKFAELNEGRIEVESELGKGSVFTYYLPTRHLSV
jgi:signal transduction histidine kinase